jgi:ADP-ribose pyrophosphatase YjhB (NUDIX family)
MIYNIIMYYYYSLISEDKESLVDAGLRELHEETGLTLPEDTNIQILCLWESVYPVLLGLGTPVRHHIVVYLLARVNALSEQMLSKIKVRNIK